MSPTLHLPAFRRGPVPFTGKRLRRAYKEWRGKSWRKYGKLVRDMRDLQDARLAEEW